MTQHRQNDARIITHGLSISPEHESAIYQAVGFARCAHRNQKRRYTDKAYINHPIAVARLVAASGADVDTITAAVLHDVIEDTDVSAEALEAEFGNRVMALLKGAFPAYESLGKGLNVIRIAPLFGSAIPTKIGTLIKLIGWHASAFVARRGKQIACVNYHSLPVLPLSFMITKWKGAKLIYDPNGLETETLSSKAIRQVIAGLTQEAIAAKKIRLGEMARTCVWEREEPQLLAMYS
ncbi:MAG: HD domain-containing protein [Rickettsiales bacterium]|jgi:hypothetical protein|nr:HD domain-containing protein [Rickettsiales bacterium]